MGLTHKTVYGGIKKEAQMDKVPVYYFTCYDIKTDENIRSKRPATIETITRCNGTPLKETAQKVDISSLDSDGFLKRTKISS